MKVDPFKNIASSAIVEGDIFKIHRRILDVFDGIGFARKVGFFLEDFIDALSGVP
jgi:hypothetical protein